MHRVWRASGRSDDAVTPSMSRCLVQVVELTAVRAVTDDPG